MAIKESNKKEILLLEFFPPMATVKKTLKFQEGTLKSSKMDHREQFL
jgi:hypothetical protein